VTSANVHTRSKRFSGFGFYASIVIGKLTGVLYAGTALLRSMRQLVEQLQSSRS